MNTPFLRLLPALALLTLSASCHKDHTVDAGGTTLDKTVVQTSHQQGVSYTTQYQYDASNRVVLITYHTSQSALVDSNKLVYDANGRLTQHIFSNTTIGPVQRDTFWYDANGRITRARAIPLMVNLSVSDHAFGYDAQGRLVADSQMNGQTGPAYSYNKYSYDAGGNVTQFDQFTVGGISQLTSTATYTYDANFNPYGSNALAVYMVFYNIDALCKNNPVSVSWVSPGSGASSSAPINCSYYTNGRLRRTNVISNSANGNITTDYYYKAP